jgi:SpoVK/Ycf46/Vps4 family AAA+-type ATPase
MAVARKVAVSSLVDFDQLAAETEGFSGADLQALLYNAHLDVIHSSIAHLSSVTSVSNQVDDKPIEYITFGNTPNQPSLSKAEEAALQSRVSSRWTCFSMISDPSSCIASSNTANFFRSSKVRKTNDTFSAEGGRTLLLPAYYMTVTSS